MTVSTYQPSARPRPQRGHVYVVVDLGGTQTRTAIFDPTGQMLTRRAVATPRTGGPDEVIAAVLDQIRDRSGSVRPTANPHSRTGMHRVPLRCRNDLTGGYRVA